MLSGIRNRSTTERQVAQFALLLHDSADALLEGVAKLNMCSYFNDKERWPRAVGQFLGIYKWVLRG